MKELAASLNQLRSSVQQIVDDVSNTGADVPMLPSPALAKNTQDEEAFSAKHGKSANPVDATPTKDLTQVLLPENCIRFNCSSAQTSAKVNVHTRPVQYSPTHVEFQPLVLT